MDGVPALPNPCFRRAGTAGSASDPWRYVVLRWNGKAALLSALFRGGVFLAASIKSHHAGRSSGVLAEALFGAVCAGFFGTLTQALRFADPQWLAELLLAGVFRCCFRWAIFAFMLRWGRRCSASE